MTLQTNESNEDFLKRVLKDPINIQERGKAGDILSSKFMELCNQADLGYVIAIEEQISEPDGKSPTMRLHLRGNASESGYRRIVLTLLNNIHSEESLLLIKDTIEERLS